MMLLSPAQVRILTAVAAGSTGWDVARDIGRSVHTVRGQLTSIREALGALNTIHAVALMDDHCPGWRPRLALPAPPVGNLRPGASVGFAAGAEPRRAGTS